MSANILSHDDVFVQEAGGERIVVIRVPRARQDKRPIFIGQDAYSGTYKRSGEGDWRCTKEEVDEMYASAKAAEKRKK